MPSKPASVARTVGVPGVPLRGRPEVRCALVTGAARRIGRRHAERLAEVGAAVVVHYWKSQDEAKELVAALRATGAEAWAVGADLGKRGAAEAMFQKALRAAGRPIDLLVNNASAFPVIRFDDMSYAQFEHGLRVDAWAPYALMRAFAAQGVEGAIVNMLDARVVDYDETHVPYILAKKALWEMTRMAAHEWAPRIRVNGIAPGPALPPPGGNERTLDKAVAAVPLRRRVEEDDLSDALLYLAGARSVTGSVLFVDSGRHLGRWYG